MQWGIGELGNWHQHQSGLALAYRNQMQQAFRKHMHLVYRKRLYFISHALHSSSYIS